jgi:ribonuclease BN (tRNA processing enzyme)
VARLAKEAQVGRLVLVHLSPRDEGDDPVGLADARRVFPGTELGHDLAEIDF